MTARLVHLHGSLKKFSEKPIEVDADDVRMIVRGLICALGAEFKQAIREGRFAIFKGKVKQRNSMSEQEVPLKLGDVLELHIYPAVRAAGRYAQIIIGAILVVVGYYFSQSWMVQMGVSMMLGGVVQLLAPKPSTNKTEQAGQNPSFIFNGTVNVTEQGGPVPIVYGRVRRASSIVLSAGLTVENLV